jgi:hypothetical protein
MKASILLLLTLFFLASCQKETKIVPQVTKVTSVATTVNQTTTSSVKPDTIPDMAAIKIKLVKDSDNSDETMFLFNHTASLNYDANVDAAYFPGYGAESLASISKDGTDIMSYSLPYTSGMTVGLDVNAKADGALSLQLSYQRSIPANIKIWIKDTYLKDSVNVLTANYNFKVTMADANSFGKKRFQLIIRGQ